MEFETEEQQIEALKKWWKENGKQVVVGAIIGVGLIVGWRGYGDYANNQAMQASVLFEQLIKEDTATASVNKEAVYDKLKTDYASTPYQATAALIVAKKYYLSGEADKSIAVLDDVINDKNHPVVAMVARERKARILIDQNKAEGALKVLDIASITGFEAIFEELRGDAYVLKGLLDKARAAYDKALSLKSGSKQLLQMKRDNIGDAVVS